MAAQAVASSRLVWLRISPALTRLLRAVLLAAVVTLLFVAGWLLLRRMGGQLQQPLGFPALVFVGVAVAALASLLRLLWYQTGRSPERWKSPTTLLWLSPSCAVILLALALSITGTSTVALVFFWGILLAVESVWYGIAWRLAHSPAAATPLSATPPATPIHRVVESTAAAGRGESVAVDEPPAKADEEGDEQLPEDICQQLTRSRAEEDADTVTGLLRARFEPSKRSHSLHVAFCPPMLRRPRVTVVQLQGPRTRIKAADIQSFGIRFDLRLVTASQKEQDVLIHFEANCTEPEATGLGGLVP